MQLRLLVPLTGVLLFAPAFCQQQTALPQGVTKVTSVEGITEYKLENGLRLLVFPDPSKPTVTVNVTYLVGSRHEGSGEAGMAHLLEHMVFKGSPRHTNIPQELTEHGARPNGSTAWDRTNYFETFSATEENLRWALDLESDRMVNSFIRKSDLDKEFTVVRNEFEMGENSPFNVLFERTLSAAYLWHSYGRAIIGNKSDIERVPIDKLQAFYRKYYQPDNAVLTIAGKVDEPQVVNLVNEYFGKIPKPIRTLTPTYTVEPTQDGERTTTIRRVGDIQEVFAFYHIPDGASPDLPALQVLANVLGEDVSGRLYKALVDSRKASRVFGDTLQLDEPGMIIFGATLGKKDSLDDARKIMLDTIQGVVKEPPSKEEVERARARLLKQVDLQLRNSERVGLFISEWVAMGDWRLLFLDRDRLRNVTAQDVQRVATAYLKPSNRTIGEYIPEAAPERATIPPQTDVEAELKGYKGDAAMSAGEAFDPSPKNIEARTTRFTLPSGMKVQLLPKKTRGASVHALVTLRFGDVESLKNKSAVARLTQQTLMHGTKNKSRQQIQDELDRLKAQMTVGGTETSVTVSIETIHDSLPAVLDLAGEVLKEAALPADEFEQVRKQRLTSLEGGKAEPQMRAINMLNRTLYPFPDGDVRGTPTIDEEIADVRKVTIDDSKQFYQHFYGASNGDLAVVGDFDADAIKRTAQEMFGSWKSPAPFTRVKTGFQKIAAVNESIETPDKANAWWFAGTRLNMSDQDPDYAAVLFGNYMLGGGFLNSRLANRIRVKDGLSYGIGSMFSAKPDEKDARLLVYAIAAPQNVPKVEAAFKEEVTRALKEGFTTKEIDADRGGWLQSQQVGRADDRALCGILSTRAFNDRTLAFDAALEEKVKSLSPEQINRAFQRHIDVSQISIIKAGDFVKKGDPPAGQ
jgi:zinc protease